MALAIRLSRGGAKKRPFYRIVVADSRMPRDGRYIERLGTYNPLLRKDDENRVKMELERIQYWIGQGARPSDRVSRFLEAAGGAEKKERSNPQKALPGKKAQERIDAAREAEEAAKTQPEEEAKPAEEEKPAEEAAAAEAPAEEAPAEEAAAEKAPAEEAPAEEAAAEEAPAAEAPSDSGGEEEKKSE